MTILLNRLLCMTTSCGKEGERASGPALPDDCVPTCTGSQMSGGRQRFWALLPVGAYAWAAANSASLARARETAGRAFTRAVYAVTRGNSGNSLNIVIHVSAVPQR